ncbi:hypothetical protein GCM10022409_00550 [Hymenobacter glaciei]|uniref:Uncharacterized protein n=1 Tax=Hymenobacter glaciei TaxID=877209 RepID=A0ABP7T4E1_9BACT
MAPLVALQHALFPGGRGLHYQPGCRNTANARNTANRQNTALAAIRGALILICRALAAVGGPRGAFRGALAAVGGALAAVGGPREGVGGAHAGIRGA